MQKLLDRYLNAREALDHPPTSVSEIMECDEARTQLVKALGVPYGTTHDALVERATRRVSAMVSIPELWNPDTIPRQYAPAAPRTVPQLLTMYETALTRSPRKPRELEQLRESIARILGSLDDADNLINAAKITQPVGDDMRALIDSKGPAVILPIDDYSDMKPLHVSTWTWAVAIVAFIVIWSLAIYGAYRLVSEWVL